MRRYLVVFIALSVALVAARCGRTSTKADAPFSPDLLKEQVGFSLTFPGYVPAGVSFAKYAVQPDVGPLGPSVSLLYSGPSGFLRVEESKSPRSLMRNKTAGIQTAIVNGQQIQLEVASADINSGVPSRVTAVFKSGDLFVFIDSANLPADEIVKVISSFPSPLSVEQ